MQRGDPLPPEIRRRRRLRSPIAAHGRLPSSALCRSIAVRGPHGMTRVDHHVAVPSRCARRRLPVGSVLLHFSCCSMRARNRCPRLRILDPIVVTASRVPQRLIDLLADVTVIDADEIARSGAQSLAELLQRQPGVEIVQNGGPGATSGVFLRGANAAQTLVLVDGLRVASASSGAAALEAIPLDQIERIEILRGPASSLYGADAIGGVIQVFTRRGSAGDARECVASATARTTAWRRRRACRAAPMPLAAACSSRAAAATASTRSSTRRTSATTPTATATATRASAPTASCARRPTRSCGSSTSAAISTASSTAATRSTTARSRR